MFLPDLLRGKRILITGSGSGLGRAGRHRGRADLAAYLMSDRSGYITGDCIAIDGGEWLEGPGQFDALDRLSAADWDAMKPKQG